VLVFFDGDDERRKSHESRSSSHALLCTGRFSHLVQAPKKAKPEERKNGIGISISSLTAGHTGTLRTIQEINQAHMPTNFNQFCF